MIGGCLMLSTVSFVPEGMASHRYSTGCDARDLAYQRRALHEWYRDECDRLRDAYLCERRDLDREWRELSRLCGPAREAARREWRCRRRELQQRYDEQRDCLRAEYERRLRDLERRCRRHGW